MFFPEVNTQCANPGKGTKFEPLNYRPVSLTSVCCKIMERLIHKHVVDYLDDNGLLSDKQFGFRKGRSTEDQLLLTYSSVIGRVDGGEVVDMVYLDFSKAFDLVCHSVLMVKLSQLGFSRGIMAWIEAFLVDRRMWVTVGGCDSEWVRVTSGVPQGSVLGPLLFLIYVNSISEGLECEWYSFADDFKLYVSFARAGVLGPGTVLQRDLDRISLVSSSWNLKLNAEKCVVMRFGSRERFGGEVGSGYFLDGAELRLVGEQRDLGVVIDPSLKFHSHVDVTVRKASGLANNLLRCTVVVKFPL